MRQSLILLIILGIGLGALLDVQSGRAKNKHVGCLTLFLTLMLGALFTIVSTLFVLTLR